MTTETQNTKEFSNIEIPEEWELKKLGNLGKWFGGGTPSKEIELYWSNGTIPWASSQDIKQSHLNTTTYKISEDALKNSSSKLVPTGSLLMVTRSGILQHTFPISKTIFPVAINQDIKALIVSDESNVDYVHNYLLFSNKQILDKCRKVGTTVESIEYSWLLLFTIPLPPLPEQKAIAQVLSTADAAIQTTEKLIAQKELRKKWLMQQLLTGKKRLKGFGGEWKEYHLGSLGDTYNGLTGKNKEDFGEGKPYIPYLNIFNNACIDVSNFDYVKITESDNQNRVKYGDIFFTVSSETPNEVGMASVMLEEIDELYLNSFCFGFRLSDFNTLVPEFSSYFLRAVAFRAEIYKLSQGATRFNLSKNNLMKLNIVLPPKEEQTAIAQVLQAADKEISLLKAKAEKLREQKKGLMQVLLTGKVRLKINNI